MTSKQKVEEFHGHYGATPDVVGQIWSDIQTWDLHDEIAMQPQDISDKGFKKFMAAFYFLWTHPKNAKLLSSRFGISKRQIHSDDFWVWI